MGKSGLVLLLAALWLTAPAVVSAQMRSEDSLSALLTEAHLPPVTSHKVEFGGGRSQDRASAWLNHAGTGALIGAGLGLVVGLSLDLQGYEDCMFPATLVMVPLGGAAGAVVGSIVYFVRRP